MKWTPEMDDYVRSTYGRLSMSQIAGLLARRVGDHISRNAVSGAVFRMGLSHSKSGQSDFRRPYNPAEATRQWIESRPNV